MSSNGKRVTEKYGLSESEQFQAFLNDVYHNNRLAGAKGLEECPLLVKFSQLLESLDGSLQDESNQEDHMERLRKEIKKDLFEDVVRNKKVKAECASAPKKSQQFLTKQLLVDMARHHNRFGGVDSYLREFARILIATDPDLAAKLERALNEEVCLQELAPQKTFREADIH